MNVSNCNQLVLQRGERDQVMLNLKKRLGKFGARVKRWQSTARQRRQLKLLVEDTDFLKDIGVSAGDAMIEANKPFWKK